MVNGKDQGLVSVDTNGKFSHEIELLRGINQIVIKATDPAGNVTTKTIIVTYDAIGPIIALQNPPDGYTTNVSRVEIRGIVEASDYQATTRLYLTVNSGTKTEIVVLADGGFNQFINLVNGINLIKIYAEDSYGNITEKSINVYYDPEGTTGELVNSNTTTPTTVTNSSPSIFSVSNTNSSGTNNETLAMSPVPNNSASTFANVNTSTLINSALFGTTGTTGSTTTNNYSNNNAGGTTDVVDPSTDERRYYGGDNAPPELSVESENGDITTNKNNIISGTTEQEAQVVVTQNGQNQYSGKASSDDGTFATDVTLTEGHNVFTTTTTDASGNMSFNTQVVELDTTGPILNVFSPTFKEKIGDELYLVTGNTEKNTRTEIYVGGKLKAEFTSTLTGHIQYEIELDEQDEGNKNIKVVVYDKMNNSTITTIPVTIDLTNPKVSTMSIKDSFATDSNLVINNNIVTNEGKNGIIIGTVTPYTYGTTEPNATVQILLSDMILGSTTADELGEFNFKFGVTSDVYSQKLTFKVIDTFGNYSTYKFVLITDANAPTIYVVKPTGVMTTDGTINTVRATLDEISPSTTNDDESASAKLNGQITTIIQPIDDGLIELEVIDASSTISYRVLINGQTKIPETTVSSTNQTQNGYKFHITDNVKDNLGNITFGKGINKIEIIVTDIANNSSTNTISIINVNENTEFDNETKIDRGYSPDIVFRELPDKIDYGYGTISVGSYGSGTGLYSLGSLSAILGRFTLLSNTASTLLGADPETNPFTDSITDLLDDHDAADIQGEADSDAGSLLDDLEDHFNNDIKTMSGLVTKVMGLINKYF